MAQVERAEVNFFLHGDPDDDRGRAVRFTTSLSIEGRGAAERDVRGIAEARAGVARLVADGFRLVDEHDFGTQHRWSLERPWQPRE